MKSPLTRRNALRLGAASLFAALAAAGVWKVRSTPVPVRAHVVERGPVVREAFGTGLLESDTTIDLGFDVAGRITSLSVDEGDRVHKGDVLGTLDGSELEGQLAMADAEKRVAEQTARRSVIDVDRTRMLWEAARDDLARAESLRAAGALATAERDAVATRAAAAEAEYRASQVSQTHAGKTVDVARSARGVARVLVARAALESPIDGVVVRRERDPGAWAQPGTPVLRVVDDRHLRVRAWVDETELGNLAPKQVARIVLRSEPNRSWPGRVDRIGLEADRQTHEVMIDVVFDAPPDRFAVGQRADVFVTTAARSAVVRVPVELCSPVLRRCFVERQGRAATVDVEPGLVGGAFFEVRDGLTDGDVVVASLRPDEAVPLHRRLRHASVR